MRKIIFVFSILTTFNLSVKAQSAYIGIDDPNYNLLNRLTTLSGSFPDDMHTLTQPLSAKSVAEFTQEAQRANTQNGWSAIDNFDLRLALSNTGEWKQPDGFGAIKSINPIGPFYTTITDMLYFNNRNFFVSANPIIGAQFMSENDIENKKSDWAHYVNVGAKVRLKYKDIVGAAFNLSYVNENPIANYDNLYRSRNAVAGAPRNYNLFGQQYSYVLPTGNVSVNLLRDYISLNLGYDFFKLGDGYRSLILSDFSGPVAYANIRTKIWKLQYDNLYLKLNADDHIPGNSLSNNHAKNKFATVHQLSVNVTKWLNLGAYEMVVFSRNTGFEMGYLNPIIFYRSVERSLGSPDKVALGINAKAIATKGLRLYGQFMLNEFVAKDFFNGNGSWANKWGAQLGLNYYDVFKINNLDLQIEGNVIRPYTFQHVDRGNGYIASNYTNNNLPLAHPYGAGFREAIAILKYRPNARIAVEAKAMYHQRGIDTGDYNLGNDLSKSYLKNILKDKGIKMVNGAPENCLTLGINTSYMIAPNLNFDLGGFYRNYQYDFTSPTTENKFTVSNYQIYSGLRLNLNRKDYTTY